MQSHAAIRSYYFRHAVMEALRQHRLYGGATPENWTLDDFRREWRNADAAAIASRRRPR